MIQELLNWKLYSPSSDEQKVELSSWISAKTGLEFSGRVGEIGLAFGQQATGIEFVLCPGGEFVCGVNSITCMKIRRLLLNPKLRIHSAIMESDFHLILPDMNFCRMLVSPFLIARKPICLDEVQNFQTSVSEFDAAYELTADNLAVPATMSFLQAEEVCKSNQLLIPTQAQWECAAKCCTHDAFCADENQLIDDPESYLAPMDFKSIEILKTQNTLGLLGLGLCREWTLDEYIDDGLGIPKDNCGDIPFQLSIEPTMRVVRGGGAASIWPWQHSDEWVVGTLVFRDFADLTGKDFDHPDSAALRPIIPVM